MVTVAFACSSKQRLRFAYDIAAAEDDGVRAFDGHVAAAQNFHHSGGRAGDQPGTSRDEMADVHRMEAVDILRGVDRFKNLFRIDLRRQRELHEDSVDIVARVEILDQFEEFVRGNRGGRRDVEAGEAELAAGRDFAVHVDFRRRVVADEHGCKARLDSHRRERSDFAREFGVDLISNCVAAQDSR